MVILMVYAFTWSAFIINHVFAKTYLKYYCFVNCPHNSTEMTVLIVIAYLLNLWSRSKLLHYIVNPARRNIVHGVSCILSIWHSVSSLYCSFIRVITLNNRSTSHQLCSQSSHINVDNGSACWLCCWCSRGSKEPSLAMEDGLVSFVHSRACLALCSGLFIFSSPV